MTNATEYLHHRSLQEGTPDGHMQRGVPCARARSRKGHDREIERGNGVELSGTTLRPVPIIPDSPGKRMPRGKAFKWPFVLAPLSGRICSTRARLVPPGRAAHLTRASSIDPCSIARRPSLSTGTAQVQGKWQGHTTAS